MKYQAFLSEGINHHFNFWRIEFQSPVKNNFKNIQYRCFALDVPFCVLCFVSASLCRIYPVMFVHFLLFVDFCSSFLVGKALCHFLGCFQTLLVASNLWWKFHGCLLPCFDHVASFLIFMCDLHFTRRFHVTTVFLNYLF